MQANPVSPRQQLINEGKLTERQTEPPPSPASAPGTQETESSTAPKSEPAGTEETLSAGSKNIALLSSVGILDSRSLVDDTLTHLDGLMKSVVKSETGNPEAKFRNPQTLNAACNISSQIYKMLRLKLDMAKEIAKQRKSE